MTTRIEITTGARLHFGLFSHAPTQGREYGGVGLMVDSPGFQIIVEPADQDQVTADNQYEARVWRYLAQFRESEPRLPLPACSIRLARTLPPHSGLGSGTQLGMAVSRALSLLADEQECNAENLAQRVGRGARSAVGLHGFVHGGFLIDAGKEQRAEIAPLAARIEFPNEWRVLLVTPPDAAGLSGNKEEQAFAVLPGMPASITEQLHQTVDEQLLPAVKHAHFDRFSESIYKFGNMVGEYFAPEQGGIFASPLMSQLAEELRAKHIHGVGQSSWGPILFAFIKDEPTAHKLVEELKSNPAWNVCKFRIAAAMNQGARVTIENT